MMTHHPTRLWVTATWLVTLISLLWAVSGTVSLVTLAAFSLIGLAPLLVLTTLLRGPEQTMSESIRLVTSRAS